MVRIALVFAFVSVPPSGSHANSSTHEKSDCIMQIDDQELAGHSANHSEIAGVPTQALSLENELSAEVEVSICCGGTCFTEVADFTPPATPEHVITSPFLMNCADLRSVVQAGFLRPPQRTI